MELLLFFLVVLLLTPVLGLIGILTRRAGWREGFQTGSLLLIGLIVVAVFSGVFHTTRGTDFTVTNAGADSTFYASIDNILTGQPVTEDRAGCQLFMRVVGYADDSTAFQIPYFGQTLTLRLPKGNINTVWGGDFYDSKARIRFVHQQATRGTLHVDVAFSYPPDEWSRQKVPADRALK